MFVGTSAIYQITKNDSREREIFYKFFILNYSIVCCYIPSYKVMIHPLHPNTPAGSV